MSADSKHIARVTLLAFLLNALFPFFAVYDVHQAPKVSPFGDRLLLCTGDGFKWVSLDEVKKSEKHFPSSHYKCPLCYLAAHGLTHFFAPATNFFIYALRNPYFYNVYKFRLAAWHSRSLPAVRAPPFSFPG